MNFQMIDRFYSVWNTGVMVPYLAITILVPFSFIYFLGFLRGKNGDKDALLGAKVVSCLLLTLALQILLMGVNGILETILDKLSGKDVLYRGSVTVAMLQIRTSLAYCLSAFLVGGYSYYVYRYRASQTGDGQVFRQASGLNAITTSLVVVVTLTVLLSAVFNDAELVYRSRLISTVIVYGAGHAICMIPVLYNWSAEDMPEEPADAETVADTLQDA
ncbi:MAG: hypothetical protein VB855_12365 [Pirellulaceae bacterium]